MDLVRRLFPTLLSIFFLSAAAAHSSSSEDCVYSVYVRTGSIIKAGTDSKISVRLGDGWRSEVVVEDLESWGLMGPTYDYYERGNLDIFSGRGLCLSSPPCRLNLTSDGSGPHHGWYCEYVEVTSTGPHMGCSQTIFYVRQWLATDASPYQLTALLDGCGDGDALTVQDKVGKKRSVVFGNSNSNVGSQ